MLGVVVIEESEEFLSGVSKGESGDPGTDSDDASECEVFVSLNDSDSLSSGLHDLISLPEEGSLNVSDDGDSERPGKEKDDREELPESKLVTKIRGTGVLVVETGKEVY